MNPQILEVSLLCRARFFSGCPIETRRVRVDGNNNVWVWDEIARHYTSVHGLTARATARILRRANEVRCSAIPEAGCLRSPREAQ